MGVKSNLVLIVNVGSQAMATLAPLYRGEFRGPNQLKHANWDFEKLVVKDRGLPDRSDHQDQIVPAQVLHYSTDEHGSRPGLFLRGTKFRDRDLIQLGAFACLAFDRQSYVPNEQIVGRLVARSLNDREWLLDVPQGSFDQRLEIDALRRNVRVDRMVDAD